MVRAMRVRRMLNVLIGPEPPPKEAIEEKRVRASPFGSARTSALYRTDAAEIARRLTDAFARRAFEELERMLHSATWMLWPTGELMRHKRGPLLSALRMRTGQPITLRIEDVASYGPADLRTILPRNYSVGAMQPFEGAQGILVALTMHSGIAPIARVSILLSPDTRGTWRAHNLPLPAIDDAYRVSAAPNAEEEEWLRVGDRAVRHAMLGHAEQLRAMRNQMMDKILIGDALEDAEKLPRLIAPLGANASACELVFLGTEQTETDRFVRAMSKKAEDVWGQPLIQSAMRATLTRIADLDPERLSTKNAREALAFLIAVRDQPELSPRWRLGALLLP
jgi:hypothetical protein